MPNENTPVVPPEGGAAGTPPATAGTPASTPPPATADAAGKRTPEERITYLESELKKVIGERDTAKKNAKDTFLGTDEGKELAKKAARAVEADLAAKKAADQALLEQGKHKELAEQRALEIAAKDAEIAKMKQDQVDREQRLEGETRSRSVDELLTRAGCIDPDYVKTTKADAISKLKIENGKVLGAEEIVLELKTAKPWLFTGNAAGGGAGPPGGVGGGTSANPLKVGPGSTKDQRDAAWKQLIEEQRKQRI